MDFKARQGIEKLSPIKSEDTAEKAKIELGMEEIIKLNSNENPLGPSKKTIAAMQKAVNQVHLYPDGNNTNLKQELSKHLNINQENLFFGNGSDEIIKLLAATFVEPGDNVHVCEPSLLEYHLATYLMSGNLIKIPLENLACNLEKMLNSITSKTKLIYLANPNHPTGTIFKQKDLQRFLQRVPSHIVVVLDEAYIDYCKDKDCASGISLIDTYPNLVILRTFSKIYGLAGLRIGYAIANQEIINNLQKVRQPFNVNSIAQAGAITSLKDKEHLERSKKCVWRGLNFYYRTLPELDLGYVTSQANSILIDLKGRDDEIITNELFNKGILVRSGTSLGISGYIRASVGLMHHNYALVRALNKIIQNKTAAGRSL